MRIKKLLICICALAMMVCPITAFAQDNNSIERTNDVLNNEPPVIEYLSQEEAERLYNEWKENQGISPYSDLQTCDIA